MFSVYQTTPSAAPTPLQVRARPQIYSSEAILITYHRYTSGTMPETPVAITNEEASIIISTLSGLDDVKDEAYIKTVRNNLGKIINYAREDIIAKLESHDSKTTLMELRRQLLPVVAELFPAYIANKTAIDRRDKHLICKDIYILGSCIVEKLMHRELDSVYNNKSEPAEPQPRTEDIAEALRVMGELRQKVLTLEKKTC